MSYILCSSLMFMCNLPVSSISITGPGSLGYLSCSDTSTSSLGHKNLYSKRPHSNNHCNFISQFFTLSSERWPDKSHKCSLSSQKSSAGFLLFSVKSRLFATVFLPYLSVSLNSFFFYFKVYLLYVHGALSAYTPHGRRGQQSPL